MAEIIYSRWKPDHSGYDYFRAPESYNRNDDLPTPELVSATKIGVPSTEAGRPVPPGSVKVGEGDVAIGLLAPIDEGMVVRRTRSLGGLPVSDTSVKWLAGAAVGGLAIYLLWRKKK